MTDQPAIVPVIDIGAWTTGDLATRADDRRPPSTTRAARSGSCRSSGTASPTSSIAGLGRAIDWFFALPADVKSDDVRAATVDQPRLHTAALRTPQLQPRRRLARRPVRGVQRRRRAVRLPAARPRSARSTPRTSGPAATAADAFANRVEAWFAAAGVRGTPDDRDLRHRARAADPTTSPPFTDHSIDVLRMNHYHVPTGRRDRRQPDGDGRPHRLRHRHRAVGRPRAGARDPAARRLVAARRPGAGRAADQPRRPAGALVERSLAVDDAPGRAATRRRRHAAPTSLRRVLPRRQRRRRHLDPRTVPRRRTDRAAYDDVTVGEHLAQKLGGIARARAQPARRTRGGAHRGRIRTGRDDDDPADRPRPVVRRRRRRSVPHSPTRSTPTCVGSGSCWWSTTASRGT